MNFTFENQGTNTYLVYSIQPGDTIDSLSLGMLTNNKILGLAPTQFTQMDSDRYIKYNVSAHVSVKQFLTGVVNKKRLLGVFKGIVNAMLSAEDYMIDIQSIIIDMDYMFTDVSSCDTILVCLPIGEFEQEPVDLRSFFKNIMFSTQFDQSDNCDYVAKIINYLNSAIVFSLDEFKAILESVDGEAGTKSVVQQPQVTATPILPKNEPVAEKPVQPSAVTPVQQPKPQAQMQPQPQQVPVKPVQPQQAQSTPVKAAAMPAQKVPVPPAIPRMPVPNQPTPSMQNNASAVNGEKEISWFYLMQHYNKDNAAAYKAQKEAKKKGKNQTVMQQPTPQVPMQQNIQPVGVPVKNVSGTATAPVQTPSVTPIQQMPNQSTMQNNNVSQQPAFVPRQVPQGQPMNFGETTVLGGSAIGETTVLNAAQAPGQMVAPHLIRTKNNEKISLNKPVFRIGKERSYVDYFIGDNTAISRSHANFITRDGEYFVVDTNSTNHTIVNGTMINSNEEVKISHGDKVRLANEEFEFRLY